ncbi:hypothetical protein [Microbacterium sp. 18062]|uniref:hypothetical protein n=1 Tax=Microbacterium sp. 18062 TaxID=2681410 RepID=UPI001358154A|nr:hypothetical protein [Microbacterium sp. 18062]
MDTGNGFGGGMRGRESVDTTDTGTRTGKDTGTRTGEHTGARTGTEPTPAGTAVDAARSLVLTTPALERSGLSISAIRAAVRTGDLVTVHRGRFVRRADWDAAYPEARHLLRVVAADSRRRTDAVTFSHGSAGVVRGLPLFRYSPGGVHVSGPRTNGVAWTGNGMRRHELAVPEADRTVIQGIPCTTLERTVYDVIRTVPPETAIAFADAALRAAAWDATARVYDLEKAESWRSMLTERIARNPGARGIRQARWVAAFADGQAQLPGESVSRLYLADLGFAPPRLQVPFRGPRGERFEIDFGLEDVPAWGEFDGVGKYFDPAMLGTRTTREAFVREKEREDWIRGRSKRPFARWGMPHIDTALTLGRRLAAFGVVPPR